MATTRAHNSFRHRSTPDAEMILQASVTTTVGATTTGTAITVPPHRFYDCYVTLTALDATGDDANIAFQIQTSDDATFTTYDISASRTVEQAAAESPTGTIFAAPEIYIMPVACNFTYMRIVGTVSADTGATCTWNAFAVPRPE